MPDKTHGELIRELFGLNTILTERVDTLREEVAKVREKISQLRDSLHELDKKVTLHDQQIAELREAKQETARRAWMLVGPFVGAIAGALLTYLLRR